MNHFDVVIVGAGSMGMAAGYYLSKLGVKTLMIDSYDPPHSIGSHHGETRIIRHAYGEGRSYVPLTLRAQQLWNELQFEAGKELFLNTGVVSIGDADSSFLKEIMESAKEFSLPIIYLNSDEIHTRWPGLRLPANFVGCLETSSGVLLVEECIRAFRDLAIQNGARLIANTDVVEIVQHGDRAVVHTKKTQYHAEKVIVCAGAWTGKLLAELNLPIEPTRKTVAWFADEQKQYSHQNFPAFVFQLEDSAFYGFPDFGKGIKVGRHDSGQKVDPDKMDRKFGSQQEDEGDLSRFVQSYFPSASKTASKGQVCMYSMTPDEDFIIDVHPQMPSVVIAAGFSGHGFKFSSVVGEILSEMVTEGKTKHDISEFSLARFL
ncbi:N-methyl-L-tryptophan oxidase [Bacillus sp. V3-13]|uniref:N-methyl-L-tryptophan oxidase n=1 Tax=Bacillus sp. V3-13 TaxID=2053728 RepID=UPI000C77D3BC|nr:N-methyl-L-tryptophan oxidase [Bacillus sp. V3-13]PLR75927.1 N-methyl-L-tryptophan oxidase [Bacillus sp. V3-13]